MRCLAIIGNRPSWVQYQISQCLIPIRYLACHLATASVARERKGLFTAGRSKQFHDKVS